ncbi:MAG: NAD(P)H-hydrate dehydratase [Rikenellaceae bacterium]|jgi:NAD(P)H-hydrate epimerase|nr:NAD(P)H-hydrate dehydratase [Rikenellaceae bacterium]
MKILTGPQIRQADRATIEREPIASIDLMERASVRMADYLTGCHGVEHEFLFLVGKGNNGGDGLAVARILAQRKYRCRVYTLFPPETGSDDFRKNFERLPDTIEVTAFSAENPPEISVSTVIVDALLGTGFVRPLREPFPAAIGWINASGSEVVALDIPSGLTTEFDNAGAQAVQATLTLTLEFPKVSLLLPEAGERAGEVVIIPLGLDRAFLDEATGDYFYVTAEDLPVLARPKFGHKGSFGHALLICGSLGMAGAAVLSTRAALRSGCGLVTVHVPVNERAAIHAAAPSALVSCDGGNCFSALPAGLENYAAVGIGPGLGQDPITAGAFKALLRAYRSPMVIDADALNLVATQPELRDLLPPGSILTPHPGELRRLIGTWDGEREKFDRVRAFAAETQCIVVVKGAYTEIFAPTGVVWFNPTGNPGMAKGGSGDVLTGLITGLLAHGPSPLQAALAGVWFHGRAGDEAALVLGLESMNAEDLIGFLKLR